MGLLDRFREVASGATLPSVSADWWGMPTLAPGGTGLGVVGESNYQPALEHAAQGRTRDGCRVTLVMAQLVREPRNKHDRNAVRVDIGGRPVGYVPREIAPELHSVLDDLSRHYRPATSRATLTGGWDRGWKDRGTIGCVLHVASPLAVFDPEKHGALPEGKRVSVTREEHYAERIEHLLGSADKRDVLATLRVVEADPHSKAKARAVEVTVAGGVIGYLTAKMSERYIPWLNFAADRGLVLTTRALLTRGPKKLEAAVRLVGDPEALVG